MYRYSVALGLGLRRLDVCLHRLQLVDLPAYIKFSCTKKYMYKVFLYIYEEIMFFLMRWLMENIYQVFVYEKNNRSPTNQYLQKRTVASSLQVAATLRVLERIQIEKNWAMG